MRRWLWPVVALAVLSIRCDDDQTGASEGITFFEHPNYEGDSVTLAGDFSDFDDLRGPCNVGAPGTPGNWDDCASSVMVSPGWRATAFEHDDYEGERLEITGNIADLEDVRGPCGDDWDDCVSSLQIRQR